MFVWRGRPSRLRNRHALDDIALFDGIHHVLVGLTFYLSEDGMLAVEPIGYDMRDEELRAVGIRPGVGHRECAGLMFARIVSRFIAEAIAGAAAAGAGGVAALDHEIGDDAVEFHAVIKFVTGQEDEIVY